MTRDEMRKLLRGLRTAEPGERQRVFASYADWIRQGAKAQGVVAKSGMVLLGVCAFIPLLVTVRGVGSPWIYAGSGLGAVIGLALAWRGARRERDWRRANPFRPE